MDKCQYPEVIVEWEDAWLEGTEFETLDKIRDNHQPWRTQTMGWLLQEDQQGVSLANERVIVDGRERFRGRTFIPKQMIVKIHKKALRKPRKPKIWLTPEVDLSNMLQEQ